MKERLASTRDSDRAQALVPGPDWNELQFVSWAEFKRMAPSILQLEITRLESLLPAASTNTDLHNSIVRARFSVRQFIACLERADRTTVEETCAPHLQTAVMSLSLSPATLDAPARETCRYILDRLNYVYRRLPLVY